MLAVLSDVPITQRSVEQAPDSLERVLQKLSTNDSKVLNSSMKHLLTILQNLQRKPSEAKHRKLRTENVAIKKFVLGVNGAQDLLEVVGFQVKESASKKFLEIESVDVPLLDRAIGVLLAKLRDVGSECEPLEEKQRIRCTGQDCSFFGDKRTDGLCSLCSKKKFSSHESILEKKDPVLCVKKCGFYGLPTLRGMCSKCHSQDVLSRRNFLKQRWRVAMIKLRAVRNFKLALRAIQKNRTRCWTCHRRVGICGIECRCGYVFCGEHRYAQEHNCPFDFKKAHQRKLLKENVKLTGKKFEKIDGEE